jgi:hypothetical protein
VTEKIPVLVGITGKRALGGHDDFVRERLKQTFHRLDKELPAAPKVLLSGLAAGTDAIAAELALERNNWLVAAVLPLPLSLYREDFDDSGKAVLDRLIAHPRVKLRELQRLADPQTGLPCVDNDLRRRECSGNPLRTRHYEQLGLWLAETATALIAVLPADELPDRLGGTARVVDYRLWGAPDAAAREVIEASRELALPPVIDRPAGRAVWRIDLPPPGVRPPKTRCPFRILLPEQARRRGSFRNDLDVSLEIAQWIDKLAGRTVGDDSALFAWRAAAPDPVASLGRIRGVISAIAMRDKARVVRSVQLLALLFCLAVLAFESHAELAGDSALSLIPYLALVAAAVFVHWLVGWRRWQRTAEDYRGVNEALRVQRAWWSAGICTPQHRVDRFYFSGAGDAFAWLRSATRAIVDWVMLRDHPISPLEHWHQVHGRDNPSSWVSIQVSYFSRRRRERQKTLAHVDISSWILFFAAQILALWLTAYLADSGSHAEAFRRYFRASVGIGIGIAFVPIVMLLWTARHWLHRHIGPHKGWTALFALPIALFLGCGIHDLVATVAPGAPSGTERTFVIAILFLSATAGAIRFVAEKLAWEAEAHRYAEALGLFSRAEAELEAIDKEVGEPAERLSRKREVVLTLGQKALLENEAWLRAHRERPVEQVIGG